MTIDLTFDVGGAGIVDDFDRGGGQILAVYRFAVLDEFTEVGTGKRGDREAGGALEKVGDREIAVDIGGGGDRLVLRTLGEEAERMARGSGGTGAFDAKATGEGEGGGCLEHDAGQVGIGYGDGGDFAARRGIGVGGRNEGVGSGGQARKGEGPVGLDRSDDVESTEGVDGFGDDRLPGPGEAAADLPVECGGENDGQRFAEFSVAQRICRWDFATVRRESVLSRGEQREAELTEIVGVGVRPDGQVNYLSIDLAPPDGANGYPFDGLAGGVRENPGQDRLGH